MIWLDLAWSWLWAHWKGVLAVALLGAAWWALDAYGDRRAAEAVLPWAEAAQKAAAAAGEAQAAADEQADRDAQRVADANRRSLNAEVSTDRAARDNAALLRRLRQRPVAARCDQVPAAAPDAGGAEAGAAAREFPTDDWLDLADAARRCADERERNATAVRAGREGWPR